MKFIKMVVLFLYIILGYIEFEWDFNSGIFFCRIRYMCFVNNFF